MMRATGFEGGFDGAALAVGDRVAAAQFRGGIFLPGPSRWYALRVGPQQEDQAEAWLKARGVYGFHPVLMRQITRMGRIREYARRYLPGYVFARFPGEPVPHAVLACPFIAGALVRPGGAGEWGILEPQRLRSLYGMRRIEGRAEAAREADRVQRRMAAKVKAGDLAILRGGVFAGASGEVVELLADGGARVSLTLFGKEVLVAVGAMDLDPISRPPAETRLTEDSRRAY